MKKIILYLIVVLQLQQLHAQSVGIGTTTPDNSAALDVSSTTKGMLIPRMTTSLRNAIPSPANGLIVYDTDTNSFWYYNGTLWTNLAGGGGSSKWNLTGNHIYNNNSANVGIGLSSLINEKFTLKGNGLITYTNAGDIINGGANATLKLMSAPSGSGVINFLEPDSSNGGSIWYNPSLNVLSVQNRQNTISSARFYNNGNIGIGTDILSNAESKLHIDGGTFVNYGSNNGYLMLGKSNNTNIAFSNYEILARDNGAAAPLYLQQDGGQVRIGNTGSTAANTRLHITDGFAGTLSSNGYITLGLTSNQNLTFSNNNIQSRNNQLPSDLDVQNNGGDFKVQQSALVVSNGNVGVGFASPTEKLHVIGNVLVNNFNPTIQFQNVAVNKGFIQLASDNIRIGTNIGNAAGNFVIRTNGTDRVFVDGSGNVNIGSQTDAPGYIFRVGGKMICEEVKVKLEGSWPDYVFGESYKLKPLSELQSFIMENKHLPNIPSAAEVEKNGIEVGDIQKRMMEKIEELTLYVIELQQQINALKYK